MLFSRKFLPISSYVNIIANESSVIWFYLRTRRISNFYTSTINERLTRMYVRLVVCAIYTAFGVIVIFVRSDFSYLINYSFKQYEAPCFLSNNTQSRGVLQKLKTLLFRKRVQILNTN